MKRCWALCLIVLFTTLVIADEEAPPPKAAPSDSDVLASRHGLTLHANVGLDVHRWVNTTSDARVVPGFGVTADYYLTEVFGFYASVDYINRGLKLVGLTSTATFIDIGVGAALRYRGNLFSSSSINYLQVGAFFAIPMGDFNGPLPVTFSTSSKLFVGFQLQGSSAYPIGHGMALGPISWVKFGLGNPVSGLPSSSWFTHVGFGAQLTF